jgi:two-component system sensor histidine kinase MtrB
MDSSTDTARAPGEPRGAWRWVVRHLASAASHIAHLWRSSLQFRVVTTTLVLGVVVVALLATYLFKEIATGLQEDRVASAEAESRELAARAQQYFDDTVKTSSEADLNSVAWDTVNGQLAAPNNEGSHYVIFTRSVANDSTTVLDTVASDGVQVDIVPKEMRTAVAQDPTHQQTTLVPFTIPADPNALDGQDSAIPPGDVVPAVVVGSEVQVPVAGPYDLYFIYPMDQEQATLNLLTRSFTVGGLVLVLLVGGVAYLVTRQVVTPVRRAASVAKRLSGGNLNERMAVRGEDDLAMLGRSFNEMADNLQAQIRQLEGLSRVQQRFVSDVSHELRTPLTTIRMASELIHESRSAFPSSLARSAELLHTEVDRFEALLADLLEISRFDAGAAALDGEATDLVEIAERVVHSAAAVADRRGSTVTVEAPDGRCVADIDSRRVERIVRNLVVNAVEHGDGKPVEVIVGQNEAAVAVVVQDHGVGLRPGESSLVFNRFWRADPARTRTTGGTGLGLAISLEDARLHHGWLQAWGEPGRGSRFRLTLPKQQDVPIDTSPVPLSPSEPDRSDVPSRVVVPLPSGGATT